MPKAIATMALGIASLGLIAQPAAAPAGAKDDDWQIAETPTTLKPADKGEAEAVYRGARSGRVGVRYRFQGLQLVVNAIEASTKMLGFPASRSPSERRIARRAF